MDWQRRALGTTGDGIVTEMNAVMTTTDWSSILMTAEMLRAAAIVDPVVHEPGVTRNFRQLLDVSERLWARVGGLENAEARGNVFLCSRGVDAPLRMPELLKRLEQLSSWPDADVDGFVRDQVQSAVFGLVELVLADGKRRVARGLTDAMAQMWQNKKLDIGRLQ